MIVLRCCMRDIRSSLVASMKRSSTLRISASSVRPPPSSVSQTDNLGPDRQTTPDFLTSMTSPQERRVRSGFESTAPRTPQEFASRWHSSPQRKALLHEISAYEASHPPSQRLEEYKSSRRAEQFKNQRAKSPYTISYAAQVKLTLWRGWRRLLADPGFTIASLVFNLIMALVLGTMFFDLKDDSSSFYYRGGLIFFALLFNAFASQLEVSCCLDI